MKSRKVLKEVKIMLRVAIDDPIVQMNDTLLSFNEELLEFIERLEKRWSISIVPELSKRKVTGARSNGPKNAVDPFRKTLNIDFEVR